MDVKDILGILVALTVWWLPGYLPLRTIKSWAKPGAVAFQPSTGTCAILFSIGIFILCCLLLWPFPFLTKALGAFACGIASSWFAKLGAEVYVKMIVEGVVIDEEDLD